MRRFGLNARGEAGLVAELRGGLVRQFVPDAAVTRALRDARAGWVPFVVTNGTVAQQERNPKAWDGPIRQCGQIMTTLAP